jgi:hypothetical protein
LQYNKPVTKVLSFELSVYRNVGLSEKMEELWYSPYQTRKKRSTNDGDSYGTPINLSNNLGTSVNPTIAASGSGVHVLLSDNSLGNAEIVIEKVQMMGVRLKAR